MNSHVNSRNLWWICESDPPKIDSRANKRIQYDQKISLLEETLELNIEKVNDKIYNVQSKGLFENLLALIQFLINLISKIINFIRAVMQIGQLIITLINLIKTLINVINQFIEWIQGLFNPEVNLVI